TVSRGFPAHRSPLTAHGLRPTISTMIGRLTGRVAAKAPDQVLLDVGGVGYVVHIPLSTFYELPESENPASLWIHTHVREDTLALYGFLTERERALFQL